MSLRLYNCLSRGVRTFQLSGNVIRHSSTRCYSSSSGDQPSSPEDGDDQVVAAKSTHKRTGGRSAKSFAQPKDPEKAKAKLNDLLQSIMKDQGERNKVADTEKMIDFKLARPEKIKPTPAEIQAEQEQRTTAKEIGSKMLNAVKKVATVVQGDPKQVESELVQKLKSHSSSKMLISEVFEGMKVDKEKPVKTQQREDDNDLSRARRVRKEFGDRGGQSFQDRRSSRDNRSDAQDVTYRPIDIFGGKPVGIFTKGKAVAPTAPISYLKTWDALYNKDLKLSSTHPPANGFEEMILWTEQGKLWKFPIDNEQDLDIEAKYSFTDHVFLEPNLESWCPKKGPIRHFMELVCIGLSRNPYLTVIEKKYHIEWYHQYFLEKADIIKDVGAGEIK